MGPYPTQNRHCPGRVLEPLALNIDWLEVGLGIKHKIEESVPRPDGKQEDYKPSESAITGPRQMETKTSGTLLYAFQDFLEDR